VIQSDAGLENTFPAPGIVFLGGDPTNDISGFQTIVKNNIIVDNVTYGIDNQQSAIHSFVSDYNCINGNLLGNYHNVTSTTDIYSYPELSSNLSDIYYNILNISWPNAETTGDYSGNLGANEARLEYHLKSEFGRWDGTQWVMDNTTSPCIDAGNPADDYSNEPSPNGSRINLGAFGNTAFTSKSASQLTIVDYENTDNYIYPTPTFDRLTVSDDCINKYYAIYTIAGKLVKYDKLHSNSINIKELNSGIYSLKIMDNISNKTKVFKIVKQ